MARSARTAGSSLRSALYQALRPKPHAFRRRTRGPWRAQKPRPRRPRSSRPWAKARREATARPLPAGSAE
eukprot:11716747-Alexandrium_andersonii.AAC.1